MYLVFCFVLFSVFAVYEVDIHLGGQVHVHNKCDILTSFFPLTSLPFPPVLIIIIFFSSCLYELNVYVHCVYLVHVSVMHQIFLLPPSTPYSLLSIVQWKMKYCINVWITVLQSTKKEPKEHKQPVTPLPT